MNSIYIHKSICIYSYNTVSIFRITKQQFLAITEKIKITFNLPEGEEELYYSVSRKGDKSVTISGVLYGHYLYCRKKLKKAGVLFDDSDPTEGKS